MERLTETPSRDVREEWLAREVGAALLETLDRVLAEHPDTARVYVDLAYMLDIDLTGHSGPWAPCLLDGVEFEVERVDEYGECL